MHNTLLYYTIHYRYDGGTRSVISVGNRHACAVAKENNIYIYIYIFVFISLSLSLYIYTHIYTYMYVCMYVCMYTYIHIYIYIYIYIYIIADVGQRHAHGGLPGGVGEELKQAVADL